MKHYLKYFLLKFLNRFFGSWYIDKNYGLVVFYLFSHRFWIKIQSNQRVREIETLHDLVDAKKIKEAKEIYNKIPKDLDPDIIRLGRYIKDEE